MLLRDHVFNKNYCITCKNTITTSFKNFYKLKKKKRTKFSSNSTISGTSVSIIAITFSGNDHGVETVSYVESQDARQRTVSKSTRTPNPPIMLFLQPPSLCFPCTSLSSLPRCFPSLRAARKISPSSIHIISFLRTLHFTSPPFLLFHSIHSSLCFYPSALTTIFPFVFSSRILLLNICIYIFPFHSNFA